MIFEKYCLTLSFLILSSLIGYSQPKGNKPNAADHSRAITINDSIVGPYDVSTGYGKELEFKLDNFVKEENSIWFKFTMVVDTVLTFDIVPMDSLDDYDFMLFKCNSNSQFDSIRMRKKIPERICFSVNSSKNSSTGLSEFANKKIIGAGDGLAYVAPLHVKQGETYFLMVTMSEQYRKIKSSFSSGFMIYFYNYWPKKKAVILKNVLFENNKANLLPISYPELDKLVNMLRQNTFISIEIKGYTDNIGKEKDNKLLSEQRAKAVCDYLASKNISNKRLSYKGMGSENPVASNENEEGRMKNRRVEFAIIMK